MPTNNFVPVAAAAGANVTSDASWQGSGFQVSGVTKGIVPSAGMNKAWRQATVPASAVAQIIVDHGLIDAVDDGSVPNFKANLRMAVAAMLAGTPFAVDQSSAANLLTVSLDPAPPNLSTFRSIFVRVANTNTGAVTLTLNALGNKAVVKKSGVAVAAGDLVQGQFAHLLYDLPTGQWVLAGSVPSDTVTAAAAVVQGLKTAPYLQFTAGTYTVTVPPGCTGFDSQLWGGGGGGGGVGSTSNGSGSAGGGGGYSFRTITGLTPGQTITLVVGAGGVAGGNGGAGGNGTTTTLGSYHSASGGFGGSPNGVGTGGQGGSGVNGDINLTGGYGSAGASTGVAQGGQGGGAPLGGQGGGGAPGIAAGGTSPGGGGGGSGSTTVNPGTPGAPGGCILRWK